MNIKNKKSEIGKIGENVACAYLVKKGYKIVERNFRKKFGEIDIVARSEEGVLVLCEVKTIVERIGYLGWLMPEDNLTAKKAMKMRRAARFFTSKNSALIKEEQGWRIDLVAIVLKSDGKIPKEIHHYQNI